MTAIDVPLGARSYRILVQPGLLREAATHIVEAATPTAAAIVTHHHLCRYAEPISAGLEERGVRALVVTVPPGERYKTLSTVGRLYQSFARARLDRGSVVVSVGGGVLGDVAGFAAATYLRGLAFAQAPTTLLAQVDAAIGGKTGVDLALGKNLVGAFHQPRIVLIDTDTLKSLPAREPRSGLAEVIKYGIIRDEAFFDRIVGLAPRLLARNSAALAEAIVRSCEIKAQVVGEDETEQGSRAILNFGHTVGHAVESVTSYRRFKHGEAISIGMVAACLLGEELKVTPSSVTAAVSDTLAKIGLPVAFPADLDPGDVIEAMSRDKKTLGGRFRFVLASAIGSAALRDGVPESAVRAAIQRQLAQYHP